jgi:hypothetical protein
MAKHKHPKTSKTEAEEIHVVFDPVAARERYLKANPPKPPRSSQPKPGVSIAPVEFGGTVEIDESGQVVRILTGKPSDE